MVHKSASDSLSQKQGDEFLIEILCMMTKFYNYLALRYPDSWPVLNVSRLIYGTLSLPLESGKGRIKFCSVFPPVCLLLTPLAVVKSLGGNFSEPVVPLTP